MSHPSSPQSSALPSPPSSPGSSFSSFPSSAFSLSLPSSPPHHHSPLPHAAHSLILPSLSLDTVDTDVPSWDSKILGNVKLLILGSKGSGKTFLAETLVHGNPDIVDAGDWVDEPGMGRVLCATTKAEGEVADGTAANVRLVEVTGFDQTDDPHIIISPILDAIHSPFRAILPLLSLTHPPDTVLRDLLASPQSHFFTAALLLTSSPPTPLENTLLSSLSAHIPVVAVSSPSPANASRSSSRARFRPSRAPPSSLHPITPHHLRTTLFRRPATLRTLRCEATDRFLWWREVEVAKQQHSTLEALLGGRVDEHNHGQERGKWEWESWLSRDVALAREAVQKSTKATEFSAESAYPPLPNIHELDPLHLPSLFLLSLSLLRPLRDMVVGRIGMRWWTITVVGAFCAGVGVGWLLGGV